MGVVYEALDPKLERHVAIKMILGATPGLLARFDREARSTGSLQHQNIVTIYEFGDQEGSPYLVMEYLEGMSLDAAISSGRALSLATKLSICVDVCNGLNYAHDRGIIHRDIKPGNVMLLEDGGVKIVDFGIARIGDTGISRTEVVGSLHYMSPEQFQSQPLDRRTDIFSTGVVLYQLLSGTLPFQSSGGEAAVMYRIIHEDPAPLSSYLQDYPPELDEIIRKALAKNRDLRYASARDLAFDLMAVMDKEKHQEVQQWMKRADLAMQRTDWTKAEESLRQVLKVDKHHTPAHQLLSQVQVRIREQRKVDQVRQLRIQADEAFLDRRYDEALRAIDQAVAIDETNKDLLSLRASIQEAKSRAARLKLALRKAEDAQRAGDLEEATLAVREALELDPFETSAKALQVVILKQGEERERQQRLRTLFDTARDQITARNLTAAFQTLKDAELLDSGSVELYSLMKVVSSTREEQFRKLEMEKLTREIEEALNREDYAAAVAIANEGLQRHPRDQGLLRLVSLAETQQQRVQLKAYARDQFLAANGLLEAGRTSEALSAIENALRTIPGDEQLERLRDIVRDRLASDEAEERKRQLLGRAQEMAATEKEQRLAESARFEVEQFQSAVQGAVEEGQRVLQKHGASEAARYLGTQPTKYRETLEFQTFAELIAKRMAREVLEQELAANTDPDTQVRLAEAAFRKDPGNEEIKTRLAAVRSRKEQVNAITERVRVLEASRRYGNAAKELQRMRQIHARYPSLESDIRRLQGLEEQSQQLQRKSVVESGKARADRPIVEHDGNEVGATIIMGRPPLEQTPSDVVEPLPVAGRGRVQPAGLPPVFAEPEASQVQPRSDKLPKTWLIAAIAIVVAVGVGLVYLLTSHPTAVLVRVNPIPEDSTVAVDGVSCPVPCQRLLSPGQHRVAAEHEGYISLTQTIQVKSGGPSSFPLALPRVEQSTLNVAGGAGGKTEPVTTPEQEKSAKTPTERGSTAGGASVVQGRTGTGGGLSSKAGSPETKGSSKSPLSQPNSGGSLPSVAEVVIRNLPNTARVRVEGGETHQPDGSGIARFTVPVGNHTLDITAEGYVSRTIQQTVSAGGAALDGSLDRDPESQEWATVESSNDKTAVQVFLNKFPAGKHAEQAKARLDKLISSNRGGSAPNVSKNTDTLTDSGMISDTSGQLEHDKTAILGVLKAYEKSYEAQDLEGLQKLWPTMNAKTIQGIADFFKTTKSIKLTSIVTDDPKIAGNEATLAFKQETSYVMNGKFKKTPAAKVNMKLKKTSPQGSWHIDTIN